VLWETNDGDVDDDDDDDAEEAVNEVKRQAVAELHRAVTAAEVKATVAVTAERARLEKVVTEVRTQARQEAFALLNSQEDSTEVTETLERDCDW